MACAAQPCVLDQVKKGDRVAQLVLERIITPDVVQVEVRDNLLFFYP